MNITLDSNPSDAPCCLKLIADDGRDILIQTDWDYPSVASTFGWSISEVQLPNFRLYGVPCKHLSTDGTVQCKECGMLPGTFIQAARDWLDDNDGAQAEDPGYFE